MRTACGPESSTHPTVYGAPYAGFSSSCAHMLRSVSLPERTKATMATFSETYVPQDRVNMAENLGIVRTALRE